MVKGATETREVIEGYLSSMNKICYPDGFTIMKVNVKKDETKRKEQQDVELSTEASDLKSLYRQLKHSTA